MKTTFIDITRMQYLLKYDLLLKFCISLLFQRSEIKFLISGRRKNKLSRSIRILFNTDIGLFHSQLISRPKSIGLNASCKVCSSKSFFHSYLPDGERLHLLSNALLLSKINWNKITILKQIKAFYNAVTDLHLYLNRQLILS